MARTRNGGNGRLEEAMANLAKSHASLEKSQEHLVRSHEALSQGHAALQQSHLALAQAQATSVQSHGVLEQAIASMLQNQATTDRRFAEMERINSERFARIEGMHLEHTHILAEHGRILIELIRKVDALTEKVREKIGFKPPSSRRLRGQWSEGSGQWAEGSGQ